MSRLPALLMLMLAGAAQALEVDGRWTQGGFVTGQVAPGSSVRIDDQSVVVDADGHFAFGIAYEAPLAAVLSVTGPDGTTTRHEYPVSPRQYPESRINGLPGNMVTPPQSVLDRIARDNREVGKARAPRRANRDFDDGFTWPVQGRISGEYGAKRTLNGGPRQPHFGVDIAAPEGTPILASAGGVVTMADKDLYYTGGTVIIDHGLGISTTYLHMSQLDVTVGQRVDKGQVIGRVGMTGRATGPHLCWRANWNSLRFDPSLLVEATPVKTQPKR